MYTFARCSLKQPSRTLIAVGMVLWPTGLAHRISILGSDSPFTREVERLFVVVLLFSILIVAVVIGGMGYVILRFRHHGRKAMVEEQAPDIPTPAHLETILTVIPLGIVLILFGFTAQSLYSYAQRPANALVVNVTGYQFWWNFNYPEYGLDYPNELVVPQGQAVQIEGTSADVMHVFWPPDLAANINLIPGITNRGWFRADRAGIYYGLCNQICGSSHAWMLFRVVVLPPDEFNAFISEVRNYQAPQPATQSIAQGAQLFAQQCAACHLVQQTSGQQLAGPNLSLFGNRITLGAGRLPNTPENLKRWIANAPGFKPEVRMPAFPRLSNADLDALSAYMLSLKLPGFSYSDPSQR